MSKLHTDKINKNTKLCLETTQKILRCKEEVWPAKIPWVTYTLNALPMELLSLPVLKLT